MLRQKLLAFLVLFLSLSYLAMSFLFPPQEVDSSRAFNELPDNSQVSVFGVPMSMQEGEEYTSFRINGIDVRARSDDISSGSRLIVEGYKESYMNRSWLKATRIENGG